MQKIVTRITLKQTQIQTTPKNNAQQRLMTLPLNVAHKNDKLTRNACITKFCYLLTQNATLPLKIYYVMCNTFYYFSRSACFTDFPQKKKPTWLILLRFEYLWWICSQMKSGVTRRVQSELKWTRFYELQLKILSQNNESIKVVEWS